MTNKNHVFLYDTTLTLTNPGLYFMKDKAPLIKLHTDDLARRGLKGDYDVLMQERQKAIDAASVGPDTEERAAAIDAATLSHDIRIKEFMSRNFERAQPMVFLKVMLDTLADGGVSAGEIAKVLEGGAR